MAEVRVEIPGIGTVDAENAATEATLKEILKALQGRGGLMPTGGGAGTGGPGPVGPQAKKAGDQIEGMGEKAEDAENALEKMGGAVLGIVSGGLNLLTGALGMATGAVTGLVSEVLTGGNRLSDFTQFIPIPGLQTFTGLLEGQVDNFRELSQVGASFGNNMFNITRLAAEAAIPQGELTELIKGNTEGLRLFGDTVGGGTQRFARLSKEFRQSTMGRDLMAMGFTTGELNENLINYNEFLQGTGRNRLLTDQQLVDMSGKYALELDKVSKLTGKSRKQLEDEMKQKNSDIRRQVAMAQMSEEQQLRFGANLELAGAKFKPFEDALLDMADGVANDPVTRQLMANSPTFAKFGKDIENMSPEQLNNFMHTVGNELGDLATIFKDGGVDVALGSGQSFGELLRLAGELKMVRETSEGTRSAVSEEQKARNESTAKMAQVEETLNTIKTQLAADLVDSKIFQTLKDSFTNLIPSIDKALSMYDGAKEWFNTNIYPVINSTFTDLKNFFTGEGESKFGDMFEKVKNAINPILQTIQEQATPIIQNLVTMAKDFFKDPGAFFDKQVMPFIKENLFKGVGYFIGGIVAFFAGKALLGFLATTLLTLVGGIPLLVIGGIAAAIGLIFSFDKIKEWFSDQGGFVNILKNIWEGITGAITSIFGTALDWFSSLFDIDFGNILRKIPGLGKVLDFLGFGGDEPTEEQATASASQKIKTTGAVPDAETVAKAVNVEEAIKSGDTSKQYTEMAGEFKSKDGATSSPADSLAMLNSNIVKMLDVQNNQLRAIRSLNGNLQA